MTILVFWELISVWEFSDFFRRIRRSMPKKIGQNSFFNLEYIFFEETDNILSEKFHRSLFPCVKIFFFLEESWPDSTKFVFFAKISCLIAKKYPYTVIFYNEIFFPLKYGTNLFQNRFQNLRARQTEEIFIWQTLAYENSAIVRKFWKSIFKRPN